MLSKIWQQGEGPRPCVFLCLTHALTHGVATKEVLGLLLHRCPHGHTHTYTALTLTLATPHAESQQGRGKDADVALDTKTVVDVGLASLSSDRIFMFNSLNQFHARCLNTEGARLACDEPDHTQTLTI